MSEAFLGGLLGGACGAMFVVAITGLAVIQFVKRGMNMVSVVKNRHPCCICGEENCTVHEVDYEA